MKKPTRKAIAKRNREFCAKNPVIVDAIKTLVVKKPWRHGTVTIATPEGEAMTDQPPKCATCRWWSNRPERTPVAECRRHAPVREARHGGTNFMEPIMRLWPIVAKDDYCGDHAPAAKEDADGKT